MKLSRYATILPQHFRSTSGSTVVLCYSTRTAKLTTLPAQVGDHLGAGRPDLLDAAIRSQLLERQILVDKEEDERSTVLARQVERSADRAEYEVALFPSSYCNMGCAYCGQSHYKGALSEDHREQVVKRVTTRAASPGVERVRVTWFGAEPLMGYAVIRDMSRRILATVEEHGLSYTSLMVTNGSLLTHEKIDVLTNECGIGHFEITLDGPAPVHDRHRPLKSGGKSFDRIVRTIAEAVDRNIGGSATFGVRVNVDTGNEASVPELILALAEAGLADERVRISFHPVHNWGNDVSSTAVGRASYATSEIEWLRTAAEHGLRMSVLPTEPVGRLCSAVSRQSEYLSPTGNVFSCSEFPLVFEAEQTKSLTTLNLLPVNAPRPVGQFDNWHSEVARGTYPCAGCNLLPVCGGACPKAWREGGVPCPSVKDNLAERMTLAATLNGLTSVT